MRIKRRDMRWAAFFLALVGAGCNQRVATVNYTQVGACDAGAHRAYVFFEIGAIDNTGPVVDFDFAPIRVNLDEGMVESAPWPHYVRLITEMLVTEPKTVPRHQLIPQGTSKNLLRYMVFERQTGDPDGSKEANQTSYFLTYDRRDADPPVFMAKSNSAQTSWRDIASCSDITAPRASCSGCHQGPPVGRQSAAAMAVSPARTPAPLPPAETPGKAP
ncbi:MAG: hypothetical protein ACM3SV_10160 [Betaproteobacteria bacterium]